MQLFRNLVIPDIYRALLRTIINYIVSIYFMLLPHGIWRCNILEESLTIHIRIVSVSEGYIS